MKRLEYPTKRAWRRALALGGASLIALTTAACGTGNSESTTPAERDTVRVGFFPVAGGAALQLARDNGYFDEAGFKVEQVDLRTPADMVPNLLNGTIDVGGLNPGNLSQAISQGLDLEIVGTAYYANKDMSILAMKDSGITGAKDLEGKTVGLIQLENNNHAGLLETLKSQGVNTDSIKFVLIPPADMPAALRSGQIDAGHVLYPLATTMAQETNIVVEDMMAPYGEQPVQGYYIVSGKLAKDDPSFVASLQEVLARGNQTAAKDPEAVAQTVAEITGAPLELIKGSKLPVFGEDLKLDSTQDQLELMSQYGFLSDPVDLSEHVFNP